MNPVYVYSIKKFVKNAQMDGVIIVIATIFSQDKELSNNLKKLMLLMLN